MSKNRDKKHAAHAADAAAHAQEVIESTAGNHEQHLVEAPKGTSRGRFLFNLFLVVFLLLIFSITGPMMAALSGNSDPNAGKPYLTWTMPDGKKHNVTREDFILEKRKINALSAVQGPLMLGTNDPGEDIFTARFLIMEQLGIRAGLHVPDSELSKSILAWWGGLPSYQAWIAGQRNLSSSAFEATLRRGMVVRRYILATGSVAGEVLSDDVIAQWMEGATEYNFEYVEANTEDFEEAARSVLIDDEALEDYFTAMLAPQKARFNTERSLSANLAWYDPAVKKEYTTLLERFPMTGEQTAEEIAKSYYEGFSHVRFMIDPQPTSEDFAAAREAGEEAPSRYLPFEEVKEQAMIEAPIYNAMIAWLAELESRTALGEEFDFAAEASIVGLESLAVDPRTRSAWVDGEEVWAGRYLFSALSGAKDGQFAQRVAVEEGAMVIAKIGETLPPELPPFPEIRDKVADQWVSEERPKLAIAKLEALRDAFGTRPEDDGFFETSASSADFRAAAEAAGLTVSERGWKRQNPTTAAGETPSAAEFYIRGKAILFAQGADAVLEAESDRANNVAYLMRCMGERDGDPNTMTPAEAYELTFQTQRLALSDAYGETMGNDDWLRSQFIVIFAGDDDDS